MKNKFPYREMFAGNDMAVNNYFDNKINESIVNAINAATTKTVYTLADLDKIINEDETLREYLEDGVKEFNLGFNIDSIKTDDELNSILEEVDSYWNLRWRVAND